MRDLLMPRVSLGDDDEAMVVVQWLVGPGEPFAEGDSILEVETSKANMEIDAPFAGSVAAVLRSPGDDVRPGELLATVADPGEDVDLTHPEVAASTVEPAPEPQDPPPAPSEPAAAPAPAEPAEPAKMMAELASVPAGRPDRNGVPDATPPLAGAVLPAPAPDFVEPGQLHGLPPAGTRPPGLRRARPAVARSEPAPEGRRQTLSRHRQALARLMTSSAAIPQFSVIRDVPMAVAQRTVTDLRARGVPATLTDVVLKATAETLLIHPEVNCHFRDGDVYHYEQPAIALAADSPAGVVAPVVRDAHLASWSVLARERRRVVEGARSGRLLPGDMSGGTFSISNVGALGGDAVVPMITPPQVAILGVGRIRPSFGERVATLVLVADHRVLDGADAARFLATLSAVLDRSGGIGDLDGGAA